MTPAPQAKNSAPTTLAEQSTSTAAAECCLSHSHYRTISLPHGSLSLIFVAGGFFGAGRTRNFEVNTPAINLCIHCSRNSIYAAIKNRETPKRLAAKGERERGRGGGKGFIYMFGEQDESGQQLA